MIGTEVFQTAIFCHHTPNVKNYILNWRTLRKKPVEEHFMFIPTSRFPAQSGQELLVVLNCSFQGDYFPIKPGHYPIRNQKMFIKDIFSMFCFHKKKLKIFILKLAKYILSSLHGFTPYHSRNISLGVVKMFQYANKILINFVSIQNDSRCFFIL